MLKKIVGSKNVLEKYILSNYTVLGGFYNSEKE